MLRVDLKRLERDRKYDARPATAARGGPRATGSHRAFAAQRTSWLTCALALGLLGCGRRHAVRTPAPDLGPSSTTASSRERPSASTSAAPATQAPEAEPTEDQGPALTRLLTASWSARTDRSGLIALPMPDAAAWTRVRYWGVTTLTGFRFGAAHHVAAAVFVFPQSATERGPSGCARRFRAWAEPLASDWDVLVGPARVDRFVWEGQTPVSSAASAPASLSSVPSAPSVASSPALVGSVNPAASAAAPAASVAFGERHVFGAERRSLFGNTRYACAFAAYAPWPEACLVVGFAIPENHLPDAARAVRQRLARDALPALVVRPGAGAEALKNKTDIGS